MDKDAYIKEIEAENEKLRSAMEKQDATLCELIRKYTEVKKDKEGKFYLRIKRGDSNFSVEISEEEVLMLMKIDTDIVTHMTFPAMTINDIVSVQPMMNPQTFQDFVMGPAPSNNVANFSKITFPMMRAVWTADDVIAEQEKIRAHQEEMRKLQEEDTK